MQTLGKKLTPGFFIDQDNGWTETQTRWKQLCKEKAPLTSTDFLLYAILRGKDFRKGFGPTSSPTKLKNGFTEDSGLRTALSKLKENSVSLERTEKGASIFAGIVNPSKLREFVLKHLPKIAVGQSLLTLEPYSDDLKVNILDLSTPEKAALAVPLTAPPLEQSA